MQRDFIVFVFIALFSMLAHADDGCRLSSTVSLLSPSNKTITLSIDKNEDPHVGGSQSWTDVISSVGSLGSFLVAFIAACYAYIQYENGKIENRRLLAYQNYSSFLQLAFDNPRYAKPSRKLLDSLSCYNQDGSVCNEENLKYKYFIANMLFAFEQIFLVVGCDPDWQAVMRDHLRRHKVHLEVSKSVNDGHWDEKFCKFIRGAIA